MSVSDQPATPEQRFAALVAALLTAPSVTYGAEQKRSFGSNALKVNGSIFTMLVRERLIVKLPRPRVDALVAAGAGRALRSPPRWPPDERVAHPRSRLQHRLAHPRPRSPRLCRHDSLGEDAVHAAPPHADRDRATITKRRSEHRCNLHSLASG